MDAKVTISRFSTNKGDGGIGIIIDDAASGLRVASVEMNLSDFAECVTGLASAPAKWDIPPSGFVIENIGKKRETKRVNIDFSKWKIQDKQKAKARISELAVPHLIDGWMLSDNGLTRQQPTKGHVIILYRFVDLESGA